MIFPDYIYNYIISLIVNHLFNKKTNFEIFYQRDLNIYKVNEVVNISTVNVKWFKMVSTNLESILNYKNYESLQHLIDIPDIKKNKIKSNIITRIFKKFNSSNNSSNNSNNNNNNNNNSNSSNNNNNNNTYNSTNNNNSYNKLIQNSKLIKVYKYLNLYKEDNKNNKAIDKIYIGAFGIGVKNRTVSLLLSSSSHSTNKDQVNQLDSNCEIDLLLSFDYEDKGEELIKYINDPNRFIGLDNQVKLIYLRKSYEEELSTDVIKKILSTFKPRMLNYYRCGGSNIHSTILESNTLESFEMSSNKDFLEPKDIAKLDNSKTKLKSLSISCLFNSITRLINDCKLVNHSDIYELNCDHYKLNQKSNSSMELDCKLMFETLSNNSTIRDLVLNEPCNNGFSVCRSTCIKTDSIDTSFICNGLASIFQSPITRIENLALIGLDYEHPLFYSSLSNNQTINTLLLHSIENVKPFFDKVLVNNKRIRNVIIEQPLVLDEVKKLLLTPGLDLYSLSIIFCRNENVLNLLNTLFNDPSLLNINLKEFTIYYSDYRSKNKSTREILNNNNSTIINIIYVNDLYSSTFSTSFK